MTMHFTILGEPIAKQRARHARRGKFIQTYTPEKTRRGEDNLRAQITLQLPVRHLPLPKTTPIAIKICVVRTAPLKKRTFPTVAPDLDNYIKSVLDAMNTVVFEDDSSIVEIWANKIYGSPPRTEIIVKEMIE